MSEVTAHYGDRPTSHLLDDAVPPRETFETERRPRARAAPSTSEPAAVQLEREAELVRGLAGTLAAHGRPTPPATPAAPLDVAWAIHPVYRAVLDAYQAWTDSLDVRVARSTFDNFTKGRLRFVADLAKATAGSNVASAPPGALKGAIERGSGSVLAGLRGILSDLLTGAGARSARSRRRTFTLGTNLAATTGDVVYRSEVFELLQYAPRTPQVHAIPLLFVPPQVAKYYVFDLAPEQSVFASLLDRGFQLYAVSWRNPTPAARDWGVDTYVSALRCAIDVVRAIAGAEQINVATAGVGALTVDALLGLYAAGVEAVPVRSLTQLVAVLDADVDPVVGVSVSREILHAAKAASAATGVLDGSDAGRIFAWLRPDDLVWNYWVNNYLHGGEPPAFDVLSWAADTMRLPARFHAEILDLYASGALLVPGNTTVLGRSVDLRRNDLDVYLCAGATDHIAPWQHVYRNARAVGGRHTFVLNDSGHVQCLVAPAAAAEAARFLVNEDRPADPNAWLAGARFEPGPWSNHWVPWLRRRSGPLGPAPDKRGNVSFPPLEPAPGRYVRE